MMQRTAVSSAVLVTTITSPHMLSDDPRKGSQAETVTSFGLRAIIDDQMQIPSKSRAITVKWRVLE